MGPILADSESMEATKVTFQIVRVGRAGIAGVSLPTITVVGKARTLKSARRVRDRKDTEYGASVHGIKGSDGRYY